MSPARRSGFLPYAEETLYRCDGDLRLSPPASDLGAEPSRPADAFALYRLYNAAVPEPIRRIEAPSFQHWQGSAERRTSGRAKRSLVLRRRAEAIAHIRSSRNGELAKIDLMVHPSASAEISSLIALACEYVGSQRSLFCLVPSYAESLSRGLEEAGFELDSEYVVLVKRTALPLPLAKPVRVPAASPHPLAAV